MEYLRLFVVNYLPRLAVDTSVDLPMTVFHIMALADKLDAMLFMETMDVSDVHASIAFLAAWFAGLTRPPVNTHARAHAHTRTHTHTHAHTCKHAAVQVLNELVDLLLEDASGALASLRARL